MQKWENAVAKLSRLMDGIAGWGIVVIMLLVVVNVFFRAVFNHPVQGVYEYVGYLTAGVVGFSISYCAVQRAHIAIDFLVEKIFPKKQGVVDRITGSITLVFLSLFCYQMVVYANKVMSSGEVSATAHLPFYPFIYMVAAGLFVLCLVELMKIVKGVNRNGA